MKRLILILIALLVLPNVALAKELKKDDLQAMIETEIQDRIDADDALLERLRYLEDRLQNSDFDNDGYTPAMNDCDDSNGDFNPGVLELVEDGIDDNCNGIVDDLVTDFDGDGYPADGGIDCDDTDNTIYPSAVEICGDNIDQDCNGSDAINDTCTDVDGDGYTADADCNDNNETIYPGAEDTPCDGIDQDCDEVDAKNATCTDVDGDGYTADADCNDNNETIYPGAEDIPCDGIDQDCNDINAKDQTCIDNDSDGFTADSDCDDNNSNRFPGNAEICSDGIDQDCSGSDLLCPEDIDNDGDGITENQGDCDDTDDTISPAAEEICDDGIDQDCNGIDNTNCGNQNGPTISIGGTVVDTNGNPMNAVTVSCQGTQVMTNSSGQWVIHNLIVTTVAGAGGPTEQFVTCVVEPPTGYLGATITIYPEAQMDSLYSANGDNGDYVPIVTFIDGMYVEAGTVLLPQLNVTVTGLFKDCGDATPIHSTEAFLDMITADYNIPAQAGSFPEGIDIVYPAAFYLNTTGGDGSFLFSEVPNGSILRLSADGYVITTISQNAFDCTGLTDEFCNDPVGLITTVDESPIDLGDVIVCAVGTDDIVSPCVESVDNLVSTDPIGLLDDSVDGSNLPVVINFTESLDPLSIDANSIVLFDQTVGDYISEFTANIDNASLIISTANPIPDGHEFSIYLLGNDFKDLSGNYLGTFAENGATNPLCSDLSYVSLFNSLNDTHYIKIDLKTFAP